jgi:hypothetical protein
MDPPPLPFQLQDPKRLLEELSAAGLIDVKVETIIETTEFQTGLDLWEWLTCSNPIVEMVLRDLKLSSDERQVVQHTLERLVRDRAADSGPASLTNPINIGIGTK